MEMFCITAGNSGILGGKFSEFGCEQQTQQDHYTAKHYVIESRIHYCQNKAF